MSATQFITRSTTVRRFAHVFPYPHGSVSPTECEVRERLTRALRDAHRQVDPTARVQCVVSFHPASVVLCGDAACAEAVDTERVARHALAAATIGPEPEWVI